MLDELHSTSFGEYRRTAAGGGPRGLCVLLCLADVAVALEVNRVKAYASRVASHRDETVDGERPQPPRHPPGERHVQRSDPRHASFLYALANSTRLLPSIERKERNVSCGGLPLWERYLLRSRCRIPAHRPVER